MPGAFRIADLKARADCSHTAVFNALNYLIEAGQIEKTGRGTYCKPRRAA
jgi:hypothetical protein